MKKLPYIKITIINDKLMINEEGSYNIDNIIYHYNNRFAGKVKNEDSLKAVQQFWKCLDVEYRIKNNL